MGGGKKLVCNIPGRDEDEMMNIWISYFIMAHKLPFGRAGEKEKRKLLGH